MNLLDALDALDGREPGSRRCSRAGCSEPAEFALVWRNPKIHSIDRRKTWLACAAHVDYLEAFLRDRDFPLQRHSIEELG